MLVLHVCLLFQLVLAVKVSQRVGLILIMLLLIVASSCGERRVGLHQVQKEKDRLLAVLPRGTSSLCEQDSN